MTIEAFGLIKKLFRHVAIQKALIAKADLRFHCFQLYSKVPFYVVHLFYVTLVFFL